MTIPNYSKTAELRYLAIEQAEDKASPLLMFLHGSGERGDKLDLVRKHGPLRFLEANNPYGFIVIAPQCPSYSFWNSRKLMDLLEEVLSTRNVDKTRIYLTGLSMGGYGTFDLAMTYPDIFAAIAPVCGGGNEKIAYRLKKTPVWAFHGEADDVVPLSESKIMVDAVNEAGGNAKLTVYPGTGHDSWTETYANKALYEWLAAQSCKL